MRTATSPAAAAAVVAPAPDARARQLQRLEELQHQRDYACLSRKLKKRPVVLFFGRATFADNSKYLFLSALAQSRGWQALWCTPNAALAAQLQGRGLPVHLINANSDRTIDTLLHAAVAVFTVNPLESANLSFALLGCLAGAQQVQLWHGVSVKQLNLQLVPHMGARHADMRAYWMANCGADHVLSTAPHFDGYWREVFGCRSLLRAGLPRNEVLLREAQGHEWLGAELPERSVQALAGDAPKILIVPTWQRGKSTELTEPDFLTHALLFARQHGAEVFFKAHPTYFGRWDAAAGEIAGLHLIDPGVDIYPWMSRFDALVTDYSSILFDYLLTGRPVLTLDLGPHTSYEPDFGLVPAARAGGYRIPFSTANFGATLAEALSSDSGRAARLDYAEQVFASDPARACEQLLPVLDRLVERSQTADFTVWQEEA